MARWFAAVTAGLMLLTTGGGSNGFAGQLSLERDLRNTAEQIVKLTEPIALDQGRGVGATERAPLGEMLMRLQAGHLLMTERLRQRGDVLQGAGEEQKRRHRLAIEQYRSLVDRAVSLLRQLTDTPVVNAATVAELRAALQALAPPSVTPIHGLLPYAHADLPPTSPVTAPRITPAYRLPIPPAAAAADLAATPETPLSPAIVAQLMAMAGDVGRTHWDPADIYNWVRANIRTEWYWGCMKGAEETLRQRSGNAADQATLLVAMLRASGYPARYVRGVIEFFPDLGSATAMTGIADPQQLLNFFQAAGIPCEPVYSGSRIVNLRIEHLWVEALVPYANYRGIVADEAGPLWVPLDTSIKTGLVAASPTIDLFALENSPLQGFRDRYLSLPRMETPVEMMARESDAFLATSFPGGKFSDALHAVEQAQTSLGILPSSLPFEDVVVTAEYSALPEELLHRIELSARIGGAVVFDLTLPLHEISNHKVMIGYTPETVADQETINLWGGLDRTPPYLVRLRPTLFVDDEMRSVAKAGLSPGEDFNLTVTAIAPAGRIAGSDPVTAGYPLLLGIAAQKALPPILDEPASSATERLHRSALAYVAAWDRDELLLADLLDVAVARPFPTWVRVGGMLRAEQLAGSVMTAEWEGLFIDADLRRVAAVSRVAAEPARVGMFMELSALSGSVHEHRLFMEEFGVEGISTAKLLGLARSTGVPVLSLDADNAARLVPSLPLSAEVAVDILTAVDDGLRVQLPEMPVTIQAWQGIGYLKENPSTGEAGYMLSGGLAGGQTVLGRRDWPAGLASLMAEPFSGPPNEEPSEAFTLVAVTPPELRLATAGEELPSPLTVLVRDVAGVQVTGALVTFTVRSGGGYFIDDRQVPEVQLATLTVLSGRDGLARVRFVPGERTSVNPVVFVRDGDRHANLVGENLIDAKLLSGSLAVLPAPIAIFGFAGLPEPLQTQAYGHNRRGEVFSYTGDALVLLKDRFGNPVANHPVSFAAGVVQPYAPSHCQNPPGLTEAERTARLLGDNPCRQQSPLFGECAASTQVQVFSRSDGGALSGVILGGVPYAAYPVTATYAGAGGTQRIEWQHQSNPFASCLAPAAPENRLILGYQQRLDAAGRNVDARPAGQPALLQVKSYLVAENPVVASGGDARVCTPEPTLVCNLVAGSGAFSLAAPADVAIDGRPAERAASMTGSQAHPWLYQAQITLPAGLAEIPVEATALRIMPRIFNSCDGCGRLEPAVEIAVGPVRRTVPVWGAAVRVPAAATVLVDTQGVAQRDLRIDYGIEPSAYVANQAQVMLFRNGELWDTLPAGTSGEAAVTFPAGYWFDPTANYELQVLLNNAGEANAVHSRRIPLLQRTAAVDLRVDGLPDAVEDQVGAFVLLNNDYDEQTGGPTFPVPDAATPTIVIDDDELKRAWLQIDDSTGQGGSWRVHTDDAARLRVYHQKNGQWIEFEPGDPPESVDAFPAVIPLYLEGLAESASIHGSVLTAIFYPAGGGTLADRLPLTVLDIDMAVDGNRDRSLDFQQAADERTVFWVNNDRDYLHEEDGLPVEDDVEAGDDSRDAVISCKRDLEDFARLHIRLGAVARPGQLAYTMQLVAIDEKIQPLLNLYPAVNLSDGYLGLPGDGATPDQPDEQGQKKLLVSAGKLPATLSAEILPLRGENPFLFEGRMPGKGQLVLTASYQGLPVAIRRIDLELVDPTWFYDHFVVSLSGGGEESPVNPAVNSEGVAAEASRLGHYRPEGNDYVLFVHGWNMQPWEKRRWAETVFKRLWWQGYQGKVGLFDWPCRTLPSWDFLVNYDRSEFIAWQSATALKGVLEELQAGHAGRVRLLAHSQGNVVAGEALRLGAPGLVHTYVASQAALSAGLHESGLTEIIDFEPKTPEVMSAYPESFAREPYLAGIASKAGAMFNYFNAKDYALTGGSLDQPTWLLNNETRPDGSLGYGYQGEVSKYPPSPPAIGFFRNVSNENSSLGATMAQMSFPGNRYEIFSFCAQSRNYALGASNVTHNGLATAVDLSIFGFDREKSSHSRQFRSNVVDEQPYWQQFVRDTAVSANLEGKQ